MTRLKPRENYVYNPTPVGGSQQASKYKQCDPSWYAVVPLSKIGTEHSHVHAKTVAS